MKEVKSFSAWAVKAECVNFASPLITRATILFRLKRQWTMKNKHRCHNEAGQREEGGLPEKLFVTLRGRNMSWKRRLPQLNARFPKQPSR